MLGDVYCISIGTQSVETTQGRDSQAPWQVTRVAGCRVGRRPSAESARVSPALLALPSRRIGVRLTRACLIAAIAIRTQVGVLHCESDFDRIAERTGLLVAS